MRENIRIMGNEWNYGREEQEKYFCFLTFILEYYKNNIFLVLPLFINFRELWVLIYSSGYCFAFIFRENLKALYTKYIFSGWYRDIYRETLHVPTYCQGKWDSCDVTRKGIFWDSPGRTSGIYLHRIKSLSF